jgi:predicted nucleic acid-binding protein
MVVAYLVLPVTDPELQATAMRVWERDREWVAPGFWASEFLSVCAGYLRSESISAGEAADVLRTALDLVLPVEPDFDGVIELVGQSRCSAYDLQFVQVARELGVPLVTNDGQVLREFPGVARSPAEFLETGA